MSVVHVLYIPATFLVGLAIGYVMGAKAVRAEIEKLKRQARE